MATGDIVSWLNADDRYHPGSSGKFARLAELCEEIASRQEKMLVFTQFREITDPLARFLAEQGVNLVLHSRQLAHSEQIMDQIRQHGVDAYAVEADLADSHQVDAMLDQIESRGTEIDVLFNNAGIQVGYREDFWHTPLADFTTSFQVNCIAPAMICYRLIPPMIERGFGRVVNITSGIKNEPEQAGYSSSKAALDKFSRDLGGRLEDTGVLLNLADPGWCRTGLGGPDAPNPPDSALPGVVIGAFIDDGRSGRIFQAASYKGMTLAQAVSKAEAEWNNEAFIDR